MKVQAVSYNISGPISCIHLQFTMWWPKGITAFAQQIFHSEYKKDLKYGTSAHIHTGTRGEPTAAAMCISPHTIWMQARGRRSSVIYIMGVFELLWLPGSRRREEGEGRAHHSHTTYTDQGHTLPPFPHDTSGNATTESWKGRQVCKGDPLCRRSTWPT